MNKEQLGRGIEEFNNGFFFEAHDTMEDLWKETSGVDKLFLQGLIQLSVGFYHFFNENYKGAVSQFSKGSGKLSGYRPAHCGIELANFLICVDEWYTAAERLLNGEEIPKREEASVPKILYLTEI